MSLALGVPTRAITAARIRVLRSAMDGILEQSDYDRCGAFACLGPMKVELISLESQLRELDRRERPTARYSA